MRPLRQAGMASPMRSTTGLEEFGAEQTLLPGSSDAGRPMTNDRIVDADTGTETISLSAPPPARVASAAVHTYAPETAVQDEVALAAGNGSSWSSGPQTRQVRKKELARKLTELRIQEAETEDDRLRRLFDETDTNGTGTLDMKEIRALCKKLGDRMSATAVQEAFDRMDPDLTGEVGFEAFRRWRKLKMDMYRRELRKNVREVFEMVDEDGGGTLDIEECATMMQKIAQNFKGVDFDPPFSLDVDFAAMDVRGAGEVTWDEFQDWFMQRTGDDEPNIPVLPEYMVRKVVGGNTVVEVTKLQTPVWKSGNPLPSPVWNSKKPVGTLVSGAEGPVKQRSGRELWTLLKPRLGMMVKLQKQWGNIHHLYEAKRESLYEDNVVPRFIRDPDSASVAVWDLAQVFALMYVTALVPVRVAFAVDSQLGSGAWWMDLMVDIYFIADLCLNFRTAVWLPNGQLQVDPKEIRRLYVRGWFVIDLVSCFPIQYIGLIITCAQGSCAGSAGANSKAIKILRLLRLGKLLRLARLQRLLRKWEDAIDITPYLGIIGTVFAILLTSHLLACIWYAVGSSDSQDACNEPSNATYAHGLVGEESELIEAACEWSEEQGRFQRRVPGWVSRSDYPEATTLGTKYMDSIYSVFTAEFAYTSAEKGIGVLGELVVGFIYGSLAGVISSIMVTMGVGQQDSMLKLLSLKAWMNARNLKKSDKVKILAAFNQENEGAPFDEKQILSELPPSLAVDISVFLYGRFMQHLPVFRGLGQEVISELCMLVTSVHLGRGNIVYMEGKFGNEMYFIISGEVEVSVSGQRLGFLGEGAFFGETCVIECIEGTGGDGSSIRTRTVQVVNQVELGVLTRDQVTQVVRKYPELRIRLAMFARTGKKFSEKGRKKKQVRTEISDVIADKSRGDCSVIIEDATPTTTKQCRATSRDNESRRSSALQLLESCNWNIVEAAQVLKDEAAAAIDRTM